MDTTSGSVSPAVPHPVVTATAAPSVISTKQIQTLTDTIAKTDLSPEECCEKYGITLQRVYKRLNEMLDADTTSFTRYGEQVSPDNKTRLAAVTLILELRKHIKDKTSTTNVAIINDPNVREDIDRVLALRGNRV